MATETTNVPELIDRLAESLRRRLQDAGVDDPVMIGIYTGGVWIAERLHRKLGIKSALGTLDISFYRDDFTRVGINPQVKPSRLPFDIDDRYIILVDDILSTGRTVRAALNEIFDYGRPAAVLLAVLVERDGRELPVQADIAAIHLEPGEDRHIKLKGPDPLQLKIVDLKPEKAPDV